MIDWREPGDTWETPTRKFRTIHLKAGETVKVNSPGDGPVEISYQGKAVNRGNRQTLRVEAPRGSSIEIVKRFRVDGRDADNKPMVEHYDIKQR